MPVAEVGEGGELVVGFVFVAESEAAQALVETVRVAATGKSRQSGIGVEKVLEPLMVDPHSGRGVPTSLV
jgi:hypothetical protein